MYFITILWSFCFCMQILFSWSLSPMLAEVNAKKRQVIFTMRNPTQADIPVDVNICKRIQDIDGKENFDVLEEENFVVYPSHFVLKKGSKQMVRVMWIGKKDPAVENAYRVIFSQAAVDLDFDKMSIDKDKIGLGMSITYQSVASLYVHGENATHKVQINRSYILREKDSKYLALELDNVGSKRMKVNHLKLLVETNDLYSNQSLKEELLQKILHRNVKTQSDIHYSRRWKRISLAKNAMVVDVMKFTACNDFPLTVLAKKKRRVRIPWHEKWNNKGLSIKAYVSEK